MKTYFLLIAASLSLCGTVFCQCPPAGLKIQTPICDSPANLKYNVTTCAKLNAKWQGNKNQSYIVEAIFTDPQTNNIIKENGTNVSCDDNGNCSAIIAVKEGTKVAWNVQSGCSIDGVIVYGYKVEGEIALIPFCASITAGAASNITTNEMIRVYPNPSTGYLTVEYLGKIPGKVKFEVFDMTGKMVFHKFENGLLNSAGSYQLDLHNLVSGSYLLQVSSGTSVNQTKFILFRRY